MQSGVSQHSASVARIATATFFIINGFILGVWVIHIPAIAARTDIDKPTLGYLLLIFGGAALAGMQVGGRLVDRIGSRFPVVLGAAGLGLSLVGPALADSALSLGIALVVLGFFNGIIDVGQNAQAVEVERVYGRPILSAFHAYYSLGGLVAAVLGGALIAAGVNVPITMSAAGVISLAAAAAARSSLLGRGQLRPGPLRPGPLRPAPLGRSERPANAVAKTVPPWNSRVLLVGVLAFALMLSEGVAYDWSTVHLHDSLGASPATAAWAFGLFSAAMTLVRLGADRVVARIGSASYVRYAALIGAAGLSTAALAPTIAIALAGWTVFGIGLAGCVPQFFSAAGNIDARFAGVYLARATGFGYVGMLAGPALVGILTHWVSLSQAFVLPIVGCVASALLAPLALRRDAS